jgi:hypothetical protein
VNLSVQHLSDEAIAAFADGMLGATARNRASRHVAECPDCAAAVADQRAAVSALRSAPRPTVPAGLLERLRAVPVTTSLTPPQLTLAPDGSAVFPAFGTAEFPVDGGDDPAAGHHQFDWSEFHFPVALPRTVARRTQQVAVVAATVAVLGLGVVASAAAGTTAASGGTARTGPVARPSGQILDARTRRDGGQVQLVGAVSSNSRP